MSITNTQALALENTYAHIFEAMKPLMEAEIIRMNASAIAQSNAMRFAQQGETYAPGTPRPADCTCSSFARCPACLKQAVERDYGEIMAAMERGCERETAQIYGDPRVPVVAPVDPLDVEYDGVKLRQLLDIDRMIRVEVFKLAGEPFTPAQRAAVSAHWSAQLRAKVDAAKQAERNVVTYCELDPDD